MFLIIGIAALLLSVIFFFMMKTSPSFYKGAAIPLLVVGLIQVTVGYTVCARSDKQRLDVAYNIGMDPTGFTKNEELPRMQTVNRNFVIYRYVEIALAITGIVLLLAFRNNEGKAFWFGLGITLAIQSVLMLGADYFAERRALFYTQQLQSLLK